MFISAGYWRMFELVEGSERGANGLFRLIVPWPDPQRCLMRCKSHMYARPHPLVSVAVNFEMKLKVQAGLKADSLTDRYVAYKYARDIYPLRRPLLVLLPSIDLPVLSALDVSRSLSVTPLLCGFDSRSLLA